MTVIKKFTAVLVTKGNKFNEFGIDLSLGHEWTIKENNKKEIHDTEEEAIRYAFSEDRDGKWLILPIIFFDYEYE